MKAKSLHKTFSCKMMANFTHHPSQFHANRVVPLDWGTAWKPHQVVSLLFAFYCMFQTDE